MPEYSIATSSVPLGGTAVANITTDDAGVASDVDSVQCDWRDQNGTLVETLTYTSVDVAGTDIYGNASTITNPAGTGTYRATLVVDNNGNYVPPSTGYRWSLTVTIVKGAKTDVEIFYFWIINTTLTVALDPVAITTVTMRQAGLMETFQYVATNTNVLVSFGKGIVYAIDSAVKNGTDIAQGTDYTWTTYRSSITLLAAPVVNDHFTFRLQRRSSTEIADYVNQAIAEVVRSLRGFYDEDDISNSPDVANLAIDIAVGQIKEDNSAGIALESAHYRSGMDRKKAARDTIARIQRGVETIYDRAGVAMTRKSGSLIGYVASTRWAESARLLEEIEDLPHTSLRARLLPDATVAAV